MNVKDTLDAEIDLAQSLGGPLGEITLYHDMYIALLEELGQNKLEMYRGMKVKYIADISPLRLYGDSDSS